MVKLVKTIAQKKVAENLNAHVVLRDLEEGAKDKAEVLKYAEESLLDELIAADYVVEWKGVLSLTDIGTMYIER